MTEAAYTGTPFLYAGFGLLVIVLLGADFVLLRVQGSHRVAVKEAASRYDSGLFHLQGLCQAKMSLNSIGTIPSTLPFQGVVVGLAETAEIPGDRTPPPKIVERTGKA